LTKNDVKRPMLDPRMIVVISIIGMDCLSILTTITMIGITNNIEINIPFNQLIVESLVLGIIIPRNNHVQKADIINVISNFLNIIGKISIKAAIIPINKKIKKFFINNPP
jgi:hypothetical protein